jgi:hypothetical protein
MFDAESPFKAAGVQERRVFTTKGNVAGLCFTRLTHELTKAVRRSTSLVIKVSGLNSCHLTDCSYLLVNKSVANASNSLWHSASSAAAEMKG